MCQRAVAAQTSGSWRRSQTSLGPSAWRGEHGAARRRISSRAEERRTAPRSRPWPGCRSRRGWPGAGAAVRVARQHARTDAADADGDDPALPSPAARGRARRTSPHQTSSASCSAQPGRGRRSRGACSQRRRRCRPAGPARPWTTRCRCRCRAGAPSTGRAEAVEVDVEKPADVPELLDVVAGDRVDVVGAVAARISSAPASSRANACGHSKVDARISRSFVSSSNVSSSPRRTCIR